jgi:hypothetical protein
MTEYKRQHFLPCCYLKFFSVDGTWTKGRNTQIYFTDGVKSKCTQVNNLGVEGYAYSKENPEFDKQFHDIEEDYPPLIEKLLGGQTKFKPPEYFKFLTIMVDFNLRSVAYENRSEVERMHTYQSISRIFISKLFSEAPGQGTNFSEMLKWLEQHWRLLALTTKSSEKFITSDNPSTIFTNPENSRPVMIYLPVHPNLAIVAFDQRSLTATNDRISDDALGVLNGLQINRSIRHTFADHDLKDDPEDWTIIQNLVHREKPERWVDGKEWAPDFIPISNLIFDRFTFIKKVSQSIGYIRSTVSSFVILSVISVIFFVSIDLDAAHDKFGYGMATASATWLFLMIATLSSCVLTTLASATIMKPKILYISSIFAGVFAPLSWVWSLMLSTPMSMANWIALQSLLLGGFIGAFFWAAVKLRLPRK